MNLPPTVMWGLGSPGVWSDTDLLLLAAFRAYEGGLCSCGQPLAHTTDTKNTMEFPAAEVTCVACQIIENKAQKDPAKAGVKRYTKNLMSEMWMG